MAASMATAQHPTPARAIPATSRTSMAGTGSGKCGSCMNPAWSMDALHVLITSNYHIHSH